MKNKLFIILFFLAGKGAVAQSVGIGTTTPANSAALEIAATNKGILIPRLFIASNTDGAAVPNPAPYLMMYNANTSISNGLTGDGLYVNTGTAAAPNWQRVGIGPTGATGPQGPAGAGGASGLSKTGFTAGNVLAIPGKAGSPTTVYVFAGTPATVTTNATQRILSWGVLSTGLVTGSPSQNAIIGAGYQLSSWGEIKNMAGGSYAVAKVTTERYGYAFAGIVQPGAGTWKIGAVLSNLGAIEMRFDNNDYVNMIYMVVEN